MKIPLTFQNTKYDCGPVTFVNALAYLYDYDKIPAELLRIVYYYSLDQKDQKGIIGNGGTSREATINVAKKINDFAKDKDFDIRAEVLQADAVTLEALRDFTKSGGVVVARCYQKSEHYVLITKIDDYFAYIFDPYYIRKDYYVKDTQVAVVLDEMFTHNRLVKIERLMGGSHADFSLMEPEKRLVVLIGKTKLQY